MNKSKILYVVPNTKTTNRVFYCSMYQIYKGQMEYLGNYKSKAIGMSRVFDCVMKCCKYYGYDFHNDNIKYRLLGE